MGRVKTMIGKMFGYAVPCHDPRLDEALAKLQDEIDRTREAMMRVEKNPDVLADLASNIQERVKRLKGAS